MRKDLKGFESLIQVTQHFSDINVCRRHLESLRWPDGKIACPHCGSFNRRPTGKLEDYSSPGAGISFYPFKWTRRTRFTVEYNYLTGFGRKFLWTATVTEISAAIWILIEII